MTAGLDSLTRVDQSFGTGDVVGPASAVNDRIAVFDGTTGKLLKDGGSTIADIVAGSGGLVTSVFGRSGAIVAVTNDYTWAQINKTTSSLADITTRSAGDLSSGTLLADRMPALTGDVISNVGTVSTAIANNAVSLAKLADIATASFLGRNTGGTGDPEVLSVATAKTMLGLSGSNTGDVTLNGQNYLTIAGQVITAGQIDLSTTHVINTLPVTKGGTGTATAFTAGSIVFAGASGVYSQDNAGLFWDNTNNRLGIGTATPIASSDIHVFKSALARITVESTGSTSYAQVGVKGTGREWYAGVGGASETAYSVANKYFIYDASGDVMRLKLDTSGQLEVPGSLFISAATASLFLKDTSTGFQSAATTVVTPLNNNHFRATNYTSGLVGWNISALGDAEFNNVSVRGEFRASVFKVNEIAATAGTFGVFFSASTLYSDFTTPGSLTSFTFNAKNSDVTASAMLFAVGDVVRFKAFIGGGGVVIGDAWATITARTNNTTHTTYTATLNSGSLSTTFRAGTAVVDYGPSGMGFITLSTDGTVGSSPNMTMATHAGSPWSAFTTAVRVGNLNGSYGYATSVFGFAAGQYGTAGQSWVTVDATNGVRLGNNTTNRIHLAADGSGFLANGNISWTTAGVASISGWTINATSISNGTTYLASGLDIPAGQVAWFGRQAGGSQGFMLRDAGGRFIDSLVGFSSIYPFIAINDGTRFRIALGGLNFAYGSDGSTDSMGMKIWDSAGALLVHFSDIQNTIAGWTIAATKISSTGINIHSGASAALAFGSTPPTSASAGTGLWLDRTGLYGLASSVEQVKINATSGAITAGAGNVTLDSVGITIASGSGTSNAIKWMDTTNVGGSVSHDLGGSHDQTTIVSTSFSTARNARVSILADGASAPAVQFDVNSTGSTFGGAAQGKGWMAMYATADFLGLTIGNNSEPVASVILELTSTTRAFLPTRLTTTQRDAMTATNGMILYNSTTGKFQGRAAGAWVDFH